MIDRAPPRSSRPVRCLINGRFIGAPATGVQRVAAEIARTLGGAWRDGEPWLEGLDLAIATPSSLADRAAEFGLPVVTLDPLRGNAWEQVTLAARGDADIVLNLCNMGPLLRTRSVTMIHDAQVFQSPQSYSRAFRGWYTIAHRVIGRRHAAVLTVSDFSARALVDAGVSDRAIPVYNGGDHVLRVTADHAVPARLGLVGRPYVVAPSSTMAHKNIALLLRAFADPRLSHVTLVLYGSAGHADFAAAGMSPSANVVFAGRVDDGGMRALLEGAVCLAFPSRTEGFGLPPLEAMHLGCPVVTTGCGAIREVCGDAVRYAGPDDAAEWTGILARLCADVGERAGMADAGRARAAGFTWTIAARRVATVLRQFGRAGHTEERAPA